MPQETSEKDELKGDMTSNNTEPETAKPTLKEKVETVQISTMTPDETEYTK